MLSKRKDDLVETDAAVDTPKYDFIEKLKIDNVIQKALKYKSPFDNFIGYITGYSILIGFYK